MDYYSSIKKNEILLFETAWVEEKVLCWVNRSVRERQIPYDFTNRWKLKNKIKEEIFHQTDRYRDGMGGVRGHEGWGIESKWLRSMNWNFQSSHEGVKYSIGNIVNSIRIIKYGARWVLEISLGTLWKVYDCLTTMLYTRNQYKNNIVNCNWKLKINMPKIVNLEVLGH